MGAAPAAMHVHPEHQACVGLDVPRASGQAEPLRGGLLPLLSQRCPATQVDGVIRTADACIKLAACSVLSPLSLCPCEAGTTPQRQETEAQALAQGHPARLCTAGIPAL